MEKHLHLLVVIPAYNEEKTIGQVIKDIPRAITGIGKVEVLVLDDGSTDKTVAKAKEVGADYIVSNQRNRGLGYSFRRATEEALKIGVDIIVNIDADGQFDPQDIPSLIQPIINQEADFVTASRFINKENIPQMPKAKLWGNKKVAKLISWMTGKIFYDVSCGFRAYSKEALLNLNLFGKYTYTQETFLDLSFKEINIVEVPVRVKYFADRKSRLVNNLFNYAYRTLGIILRTLRDYRPLKFFSMIGGIIFSLGFLLDIFVFANYFKTGGFSPYKAVAFTGAFLNVIGFAIFMIGLLADMLYRIRMNQEKLIYYEKRKYYKVDKNE